MDESALGAIAAEPLAFWVYTQRTAAQWAVVVIHRQKYPFSVIHKVTTNNPPVRWRVIYMAGMRKKIGL
jgi:hypothetical protein